MECWPEKWKPSMMKRVLGMSLWGGRVFGTEVRVRVGELLLKRVCEFRVRVGGLGFEGDVMVCGWWFGSVKELGGGDVEEWWLMVVGRGGVLGGAKHAPTGCYRNPNRIKLSATFDALNRISGKHRALFSSFLGDLVREHIGLKILSWKKMGSEARDKIWDEITGETTGHVLINGAAKEIGMAVVLAVTKAGGMEVTRAVDSYLVGEDIRKQIKALLQSTGTSFCPNYVHWFGIDATDVQLINADRSVVSKFLQASPSDYSTTS
ncbi:reverse transcriptase domain-containing protein [Tanacetum coccineum]|uniref:Reverse transcriptase domain-containing protein n=1 Tax=Tanacetum coccineum TaxID=301880 RepID=A0ABQ5CZA2_9ASTR